MACFYIYRGHKFTEPQLDEFLMNNGIEFIKKYGDEVFSTMTSELQFTHGRLRHFIDEGKKIRLEHILEVLSASRAAETNYASAFLEINDVITDNTTYKPITHVLKGLKSIMTDKLLMPEFIVENYFNERIKDWKRGNFKKEEFDLLFPDGVKPETITNEMIESFKLLILDMWKALADIGSEIHKGCQMYFSGGNIGGRNVLYRNLPKLELIKLMRERLDENLITDAHINQIYNYCFNLHQKLRNTYGCEEHLDLNFYTEMTVFGDAVHPETLDNISLIGMIDLLVVDPKGGMHIIDYKTSPHNYYDKDNTDTGYSSAKKLAFTYQLNIYLRLLNNALNINPPSQDINVAPIQLKNFRKDGDKWTFDTLGYNSETFIDNLSSKLKYNSTVNDNLDLMIPNKRVKDVDGSNIYNKVSIAMGELFQILQRIKTTDEEGNVKHELKFNKVHNSVKYEIEEVKDFVDSKNPTENEKGEWSINLGRLGVFEGKTKAELYERVRNKLNSLINRVSDFVNSIKGAVENENPDVLDFGSNIKYDDLSITWSEDFIRLYCDGNWLVIQVPPELEAMGCLILKNKHNNTVDIVKITHNVCTSNLNLVEGRKNLTAKFEADIVEDSKSDSFMLKSKRGNIDLMEIMLAINLMPNRFENLKINKIKAFNPIVLDGITASARELKYCFKALRNHAKKIDKGKWKEYMEEDNFDNGKIHLCTASELAFNDFKSVTESGAFRAEGTNVFKSCSDELELLVYGQNPLETIERLKLLRELLEDKYPHLKKKEKKMEKFGDDNLEKIYSEIDVAIAELEGVEFRQQNEDPLKFGSPNILKGHSGLYSDNPGVMNNYNINLLTSVVMTKFLHVKNNMQNSIADIRNLMINLKQSEGFNYFKERLGGNKVDLFKGLTYRTTDGDWLMVDPDTLPSGPKKEFAEYFLKTVNDNRFGPEKALSLKEQKDVRYFRVPLAPGGNVWLVNSALEAIKFKFRSLLPKEIMEQAKDKIYNLLSETSDLERNVINNALWEMTTTFDGGEDESTRLRHLNKKDRPEGYFEHDLEKLLLMHIQAYETKRAMDDVLPIMRAGQVFLVFSKLSLNRDYTRSLKYLQDYVKSVIFNKPLVTDSLLKIMEYTKKFMSVASKMALGLSPRLLYQGIEGIWKGLGLVLRGPTGVTLDGVNQFNKDDFIKSFFNTMSELAHFGTRRSKLELINEKYGVNDMDTNSYAARVLDDHSLFYNFNTFLFRMASRPDFYNRLTILLTQMRADGVWDALRVEDGKLIYDWYADRRFSALSTGNKSHPDYNKLFALYKEMFELMKKEKLIDPKTTMYDSDGKIRPLTEPYTIQQTESYKALSDMMYGYYSHERRSLMQSMLVGGLVLQMYTYWSGKKNQYFSVGSIKNLGKYVHEKDSEGNPLYYLLDANGLPDYTKELTTDPTNAPVIKWQGQFSEGVFVTLSNIYNDIFNNGQGVSETWKQYWDNKDDNLKTIYRSNLIQLMYELSMFALVGNFVGGLVTNAAKEYVKDNPALGNFAQAFLNSGALIGSDIFKSSFLDLNFLDSIGGRGINWTPFSISMAQHTFLNWSRFFFGDRDFITAFGKSFSATNQFNLVVSAVRYNMNEGR